MHVSFLIHQCVRHAEFAGITAGEAVAAAMLEIAVRLIAVSAVALGFVGDVLLGIDEITQETCRSRPPRSL